MIKKWILFILFTMFIICNFNYAQAAWNQINTDGFGDPNNESIDAIIYGSSLYAETGNGTTGGEVWRYDGGTSWTQINTDGFGDKNNVEVSLELIYNNTLYAVTENDNTGFEVWRYDGGTSWTRVDPGAPGPGNGGFGDGGNNAEIEIYVYNFFYTTLNAELWQYSTPVYSTVYIAPDGLCDGNSPCYPKIQDGIDWDGIVFTIKAEQGIYDENIIFDEPKQISLQGGWDSTFTSQSGTTNIDSMTISDGALVLDEGCLTIGPPTSLPEIVIAEITGNESPLVALATNKDGDEVVGVIGEKDENGNIINIGGFVHTLSSGLSLAIELGPDGLPVSLTGNTGNKAVFSNYTDNTVDVTFFDENDTLIAGPVTVEIDLDAYSEYLSALSSLEAANLRSSKLSFSLQEDLSSGTFCVSPLLKDLIVFHIKYAGIVISMSACAAALASSLTIVTIPLAIAACGGAFLSTLALLPAIGITDEAFMAADTVSTKIGELGCFVQDWTNCVITYGAIAADNLLVTCDEVIPPDTPTRPWPGPVKPSPPPTDAFLAVGASPSEGGSVTGPGISCPGHCTETYPLDANVTLWASPAEDYYFKNWSGACSGRGPCDLTMDADKGVIANFSIHPHMDRQRFVVRPWGRCRRLMQLHLHACPERRKRGGAILW